MKEAAAAVNIVTPEGVPLRWNVARAGERLAAFFIDLVVIVGALVVVGVVASLAGGDGWSSWIGVLLQLFAFLLGNFYFTFFELRWQGQTPGKRSVGIRVVDRHGGPLRPDAVFGRNLMRQIELFLPLGLLVNPEALWPDAPAWGRLASLVWAFVLALLPLWNRQRLRIGDVVAGTMVVQTPRAALLDEVGGASDALAFTAAQLDVYGVYELQVLEGLLRDHDAQKATHEGLAKVAEAIKKKIQWQGEDVNPEKFLRAFYGAQRARLERGLLFGKRKADKYARS